MFKVQEGFGDFADGLAKCWDVADVATFATKEEAASVAREWLSFATGDSDSVYVVAVPADWEERDGSELPSLWDHLHTIPRDRWTFLHGSPDK